MENTTAPAAPATTYRNLPVDLLPESVQVYGQGEYGAYCRYTDGRVSVYCGTQDDAECFAADLREREEVAHTEVIVKS